MFFTDKDMEGLLTMELVSKTLLLILFIWCIQFHVNRRKLYNLAEQFSGPPCLPIIGNALKCIIPLTEITDVILKACTYYKSPARLWFGPYLSVFIWDPENVRIVLNSPHALAKQPYLYNLVEPITGRGIMTSPVEEWKRHRKLIASAFNQRQLEGFCDVFRYHSEQLLDDLQIKADCGIFDADHYLVKYSINSVLGTILDFPRGSSRASNNFTLEWVKIMFEAAMTRATTIWYASSFIFNMSTIGRKVRKAKEEYQAFMDAVIKEWAATSATKTVRAKDHLDEFSKPKKLLEHLLSTSNGCDILTAEELRGEVNTILLAGLETTTSALGFVLIMLGMHAEIQEKLYQEIVHVVDKREGLQYNDLKQLAYLERVIKETLRIFPPAVGFARYSEQDIQLENHTIPAHTTIVIGLMSLHRHPNIWPDPTKFNPDRFLPEEHINRHPYSWIPFSAGPRNCIGIRFAWISLRIAVANFMLRYKVWTDYKDVEDVRLTTRLMYEPTHGYRLAITPR